VICCLYCRYSYSSVFLSTILPLSFSPVPFVSYLLPFSPLPLFRCVATFCFLPSLSFYYRYFAPFIVVCCFYCLRRCIASGESIWHSASVCLSVWVCVCVCVCVCVSAEPWLHTIYSSAAKVTLCIQWSLVLVYFSLPFDGFDFGYLFVVTNCCDYKHIFHSFPSLFFPLSSCLLCSCLSVVVVLLLSLSV